MSDRASQPPTRSTSRTWDEAESELSALTSQFTDKKLLDPSRWSPPYLSALNISVHLGLSWEDIIAPVTRDPISRVEARHSELSTVMTDVSAEIQTTVRGAGGHLWAIRKCVSEGLASRKAALKFLSYITAYITRFVTPEISRTMEEDLRVPQRSHLELTFNSVRAVFAPAASLYPSSSARNTIFPTLPFLVIVKPRSVQHYAQEAAYLLSLAQHRFNSAGNATSQTGTYRPYMLTIRSESHVSIITAAVGKRYLDSVGQKKPLNLEMLVSAEYNLALVEDRLNFLNVYERLLVGLASGDQTMEQEINTGGGEVEGTPPAPPTAPPEASGDASTRKVSFKRSLQIATMRGDKVKVRKLLAKADVADVNALGGELGTALGAAAYRGDMDMLKLLLDSGADVNAQDERYGTALQAAAYRGNTDVVKILLEKGANVNAKGGYYTNPLYAAVHHGNTDLVILLLDSGADVDYQGGHYGTALQAAAYRGNTDIARILIEHGADVNAKGGYYTNPLNSAVNLGHTSVVELLIERGAEVNAHGGHYGNALQIAASLGSSDAMELLIGHGADVNAEGGHYGTALQAAAHSGNTDAVRLLLDSGADVIAKGGYYGTALQAAAHSGNTDAVRILLDSGADVNAKGGHYGNALQAAVPKGNIDVVKCLLDSNANPNQFQKVLHAAASKGNLDIVKLLFDHGVNLDNKVDRDGPPLYAAARYGHTAVVQFLIDNGADVNRHGGCFGYPLQAAARHGYTAVVQFLIDHGADVNRHGGSFRYPLQAAARYGHTAIVQCLIDNGANVTVKSLRAANTGKNEGVLQLLKAKRAQPKTPKSTVRGRTKRETSQII